jgi:membrane protein implicated in regulation of membrane protease activity
MTLLRGLRVGRRFFKSITFLCGCILGIFVLFSSLFLWLLVYFFYEPYMGIALFMIRLFQLGFLGLAVGAIFYYFLSFLYIKLYHDKFKRFEKKTKKKK